MRRFHVQSPNRRDTSLPALADCRGFGNRPQRQGWQGSGDALPFAAKAPLARHLEHVRCQHLVDLRDGAGWAELPDAVSRKYPAAGREWPWQWVFAATRTYTHPVTGERRRHHLLESVLQRSMHDAVRKAGLGKPASCHTFRPPFATHLLEDAYNIRTVQELVGHRVSTAMIYTHVLNRGRRGVRSPADALPSPQGDDARGLDCTERSSHTALPRSLTQVGGDRRSSVSRRLRTG